MGVETAGAQEGSTGNQFAVGKLGQSRYATYPPEMGNDSGAEGLPLDAVEPGDADGGGSARAREPAACDQVTVGANQEGGGARSQTKPASQSIPGRAIP